MKVKVSEAQGLVFDWMVAKCEGGWVLDPESFIPHHHLGRMNFSSNWSQGGPIIEREIIDVDYDPGEKMWTGHWFGSVEHALAYGPTPLIAAMRCYVASKLGDEVEVPDELIVE